MENIIKAGPNVVKGHLKHLDDHNEKKLLNQAIFFLKEKNMEVPDYEEEKTFACGCPGSMEMDLGARFEIGDQGVILSAELRNWPV